MLLFNPVITQTRVCPSGERYDWGASYSMKFFAPPPHPPPPLIKADATPVGCPFHLKMNSLLTINLQEVPSQEMIPGKNPKATKCH